MTFAPKSLAGMALLVLLVLQVVCNGQGLSAPRDGHVRTIAGTGTAGYSGDGGPATAATLNEPSQCSFGPRGELYVAEAANHTVRMIDTKGVISTVAGCGEKGYSGDGEPATKARMNEPYGVFCDRRGNLYIVDRLNAAIRRVDGKTRVITTIAGTGKPGYSGDGGPATSAQMTEPHGIALDEKAQRLYVADVADSRIRVIDLATGVISTFAGNGKRAFSGDSGPAAEASINGARAVAVGRDGTVYICEREGNRIREVNASTGTITTMAGTGSAGYSGDGRNALGATFRGPKWIAVGDDDALYVADTENHAIRRIDGDSGVITTVMGTGVAGSAGDGGPARAAQLDRPHGCCMRNGVLYVADTLNHRIRACSLMPGTDVAAVAGATGSRSRCSSAVVRPPSAEFVNAQVQVPPKRIPTLERLEPANLRKLHDDVGQLRSKQAAVSVKTGFEDYRCVLHAHSYLSHDSRGTIEEIVRAAEQAHVDALFLSNHPKKDQDVVAAGQSEPVGKALFVSGAETNGFLAYPGDRKLPPLSVGEQEFVNSIDASHGLVFIAHPEEHKDWSLTGLTGAEIYNTHADLMDETELLKALQPKDRPGYTRLLGILNAVRDYPREVFAALFDPPLENLAHYDALCRDHVVAAIAGNDSHQNTGFVLKGLEGDQIAVESPLGERMGVLDAKKDPILATLFGKPEPGKELMRRLLDPYAVSFGYVSTHVLAKERTIPSMEDALRAGRTYVAFDWMGDPTGTAFIAKKSGKVWTIGDTVPNTGGVSLVGEAPLPCSLRIVRNGQEVARAEGRSITCPAQGPGIYRMEASLNVGGETRSWIYTGAIRIQ